MPRTGPAQDCTLDYVKTLPLDQVWAYALKYLKLTETKRKLNRVYRQLDHVKNQRRKYYYVRNDIYHPTYNASGAVEKRHKRPAASCESAGSTNNNNNDACE